MSSATAPLRTVPQASRYSARDVLLDLFGANRDPLPVGLLLSTASLFGFREASVRVALSRLTARGTLERHERNGTSYYGFSPQAARTKVRIRDHVYADHRLPWAGQWMLVSLACPDDAKSQREGLARELGVWHFRSLNRGLWIRPANLAIDLGEALEDVRRVGSADLFVGSPVEGSSVEARVPELWGVAALASEMQAALEELRRSEVRVRGQAREQALVETFRLGTRAFRLLVADPLLPLELLPASWPGERLRRAVVDYNHLSCDLWSEVQGVAPDRNPLPRRS